jgi:hypothetical protein
MLVRPQLQFGGRGMHMEEVPSSGSREIRVGKPTSILRQAALAIALTLMVSGPARTDPVPDRVIHELPPG